MGVNTYKVVTDGSILAGYDLDVVKKTFSQLLKLEQRPDQLEMLFSGRWLTIKKGMSQEQANTFAAKVQSYGLQCRVVATKPNRPSNELQPVKIQENIDPVPLLTNAIIDHRKQALSTSVHTPPQEKPPTYRLPWILYFWLLIIVAIVASFGQIRLQLAIDRLSLIDIVIPINFAVALHGLYGFIVQEKLSSQRLWQLFFSIFSFFTLVWLCYSYWKLGAVGMAFTDIMAVIAPLSAIVFLSPLLYALFIYSFRPQDLDYYPDGSSITVLPTKKNWLISTSVLLAIFLSCFLYWGLQHKDAALSTAQNIKNLFNIIYSDTSQAPMETATNANVNILTESNDLDHTLSPSLMETFSSQSDDTDTLNPNTPNSLKENQNSQLTGNIKPTADENTLSLENTSIKPEKVSRQNQNNVTRETLNTQEMNKPNENNSDSKVDTKASKSENNKPTSQLQTATTQRPAAFQPKLRLTEIEKPEEPFSPEFQDPLQDGSLGPKMMVIPAGSFIMGDQQGKGDETEQPLRKVVMHTPFAMSAYEVTYNDYRLFSLSTGRKPPKNTTPDQRQIPVVYVSWNDAKEYATWLSKQTGKKYRLPSEAEWEYAARAGKNTNYTWGNQIGLNKANCKGCGNPLGNIRLVSVGSFLGNRYGLYDLHGNAWEWIEDCFHDNYGAAPTDGSAWTEGQCNMRGLRGGSWRGTEDTIRLAKRRWYQAYSKNDMVGFRLVRELRDSR